MTWESEFTSQWQIFLDSVETRIRREIDRKGKLDSVSANSIIQSEVTKWSISTHYNGAWLRNLTNEHPAAGEEFKATLEKLSEGKKPSFNLDFPIFYFLVVTVLVLGSFFILRWLEEPLIRQLLGTIVVAMLTIPVASSLWNKKKQKTIDSLVGKLHRELQVIKQKLKHIAFVADEGNIKNQRNF